MTSIPKRPVRVLASTPHDGVALPVYESLLALGYRAELRTLDEPWQERLDDVLLVIVGPMYPFARVTTCLGARLASGAKVVAWFTEQTPDPSLPRPVQRQGARALAAIDRSAARTGARVPALDALTDRFQRRAVRLKLTGHLAWLHRRGQLQHLAVLAPSHVRYFEGRLGIPASCVPFGYHRSHGEDLGLKRDIDVLFLGSAVDARRRRALTELGASFAARGIRFVVMDGASPARRAFGDARTELLNRSRILVNVPRQPWDDPVFRMLLAAPCGAMLLSEPTVDEAPFRAGEHFVASALDEMPAMVERYLANDGAREAIVAAARAQVVGRMPLLEMTERLMSLSLAAAPGRPAA